MSGGGAWRGSSPTTIGREEKLVRGIGNNEEGNMAYAVIEALEALR